MPLRSDLRRIQPWCFSKNFRWATLPTVYASDGSILFQDAGFKYNTTAWELVTVPDNPTVPAITIAANNSVPPTNYGVIFEPPVGHPGSATFTVTLSAASQDTINVHYATQDGTAKAGTDYTADTGIVTFAPGQTSAEINVPILPDNSSVYSETFSVVLSNPSDNNGGPTPTIAEGTAAEYILSQPSPQLTRQVSAITNDLYHIANMPGYIFHLYLDTGRALDVANALSVNVKHADQTTSLLQLFDTTEVQLRSEISGANARDIHLDVDYLHGLSAGLQHDSLGQVLSEIAKGFGGLFGGYGEISIMAGYEQGLHLSAGVVGIGPLNSITIVGLV